MLRLIRLCCANLNLHCTPNRKFLCGRVSPLIPQIDPSLWTLYPKPMQDVHLSGHYYNMIIFDFSWAQAVWQNVECNLATIESPILQKHPPARIRFSGFHVRLGGVFYPETYTPYTNPNSSTNIHVPKYFHQSQIGPSRIRSGQWVRRSLKQRPILLGTRCWV